MAIKEALKRGTSVYLPGKVIPMLPERLSNGICSLNAGEDRLAMSCVMTIDEKGEVSEYEISESIIHVDARLSYNGVMRLFDENDDSEIAQSLSWQGYRGIKGRTKKLAKVVYAAAAKPYRGTNRRLSPRFSAAAAIVPKET